MVRNAVLLGIPHRDDTAFPKRLHGLKVHDISRAESAGRGGLHSSSHRRLFERSQLRPTWTSKAIYHYRYPRCVSLHTGSAAHDSVLACGSYIRTDVFLSPHRRDTVSFAASGHNATEATRHYQRRDELLRQHRVDHIFRDRLAHLGRQPESGVLCGGCRLLWGRADRNSPDTRARGAAAKDAGDNRPFRRRSVQLFERYCRGDQRHEVLYCAVLLVVRFLDDIGVHHSVCSRGTQRGRRKVIPGSHGFFDCSHRFHASHGHARRSAWPQGNPVVHARVLGRGRCVHGFVTKFCACADHRGNYWNPVCSHDGSRVCLPA